MLKVLLAKRMKKQSGYVKFSLIVLICLLNAGFSLVLANDSVKDNSTANQMQRIKSAFIFNIAHYVTWQNFLQDKNKASIKLCFFKYNPLGNAINSIAHKSFLISINHNVKKLPVSISAQVINTLSINNHCQILYLTQDQVNSISLKRSLSYDSAQSSKYSLLTSKDLLIIADSSHSKSFDYDLDQVTIYLIRQGDRLGININHTALSRSNLKLSSQLLKLSKDR
jgi:hypothetical protein